MPARVWALPAVRCYLYCYLTFRPSGGAGEVDDRVTPVAAARVTEPLPAPSGCVPCAALPNAGRFLLRLDGLGRQGTGSTRPGLSHLRRAALRRDDPHGSHRAVTDDRDRHLVGGREVVVIGLTEGARPAG